ncbi:MAG TPA: hypothetical protein VI727_03805 [Candidatus Brocadiaceae bacterium]|nr:hypothetical protein [Candidatus Brocadiaceae bacterium]
MAESERGKNKKKELEKLNAEARELEYRIAENVWKIMESIE